MKRIFVLFVCLGLLATGCSHDEISAPETTSIAAASAPRIDPGRIATEILAVTGWEVDAEYGPPSNLVRSTDKAGPVDLTAYDREDLGDGIAHYWFEFPIGTGPYEMIRLHRVVREQAPYQPIRTKKNLFALHGSPGNFRMMFLFGAEAPSVPDELSFAIYLAQQDIDVWGIDRPCNFVPAEQTDFSFMADWGVQFNVDALRTGLAIARTTRLFTGGGPAPLNLLGYSSGVAFGYAALNEEAGLLPPERSIGGFIPVDNNYLVAPGPDQEGACATYEATRDLLDSGVYSADYGVLFNTVSILARTAPDDPSPIVPGFNNREAALVIGSMTWLLLGVGPPPHFFAGVFDAGTGIPVDLAYTTFDGYLDFLMLPTPYEEIAPDLDIAAMRCGQIDSPFDDNLSQVRVPVLHVGAAGGITPRDDVTLGVLGSNDITTLTVRLQPVGAEVTDIGHVDLFTSQAAVDAFWRPVATWIDKHSNGRYYGERRGQVN